MLLADALARSCASLMRAAMSASGDEAVQPNDVELACGVSGPFSAVPTGRGWPSTGSVAPASASGFSISGCIRATLPGNGANASRPHQSSPADLHHLQTAGVNEFINLRTPDPERAHGVVYGYADRFHELSSSSVPPANGSE